MTTEQRRDTRQCTRRVRDEGNATNGTWARRNRAESDTADSHVHGAMAQTNRWVLWGISLTLLMVGFGKAFAAMGQAPATINGQAIAWPVPTWSMFAWTCVAVVGVLFFSAGWQIRGSVEP